MDDTYNWTTAMSEWISAVNGRTDDPSSQTGFAGHTDWRLPTIVELRTILLEPFPCSTSPCIDPIFGPTASSLYWSASTLASGPGNAWRVNFILGGEDFESKANDFRIRAVRTGP
ncbi:MAG: DUF1566 domain-containing protein [Gammaproteobacteria bacterium]